MRITALIPMLVLTTLSLAAAQTKAGVAALPTPDGALLRWYLPNDTLPTRGFVVRVTGGPTLITVPVAAPQPFSPALGLSKDDYTGLTTLYAKPPTTSGEKTSRALLNLNILARPAYARALGIQTTVTGLKPGRYTVTVVALGASGESAVGAATLVTGPTPPVPPPAGVTAKPAGKVMQITWTVPKAAADNLVVAYHVYRATGSGAFALLQPAPFFLDTRPGGDLFKDPGLTVGATYHYRVTAIDLYGRESDPTAPVTVELRDAAALPTPEDLQARVQGKTVTLTWTPVKDARVKKVLMARGTDPSQPLSVLATLPAGTQTYSDTTGVPGTSYIYALVSQDASGTGGSRTGLVSARPVNLTPPHVPAGLKVTASTGALTLTWTANAEPDLMGYQVYRGEEAGSRAELLLNSAPLTKPSYTDTIPAGVMNRYYYRVVAVNTSQTASSPSAEVSAILVDQTPPPAPALLPATVLPMGVLLVWTQAPVPDLSSFEIHRAVSGQPAQVIASPSGTARTFTDTTAQPGVSYSYTLVSIDQAGNRSVPALPIQSALPAGAVALPNNARAILLPGGKGVELTWAASAGVQVVVYRLTTEGGVVQVSGTLGAPPYTDGQGTATSRYALRAVRSDGQISALTPAILVTNP